MNDKKKPGSGQSSHSSHQQVDATTGDPAYDLTQTPGGSSGGAPYDPQKPGSGVDREDGGGGRESETNPDRNGPDRTNPDRTDPDRINPDTPERKPPPIHEPEPAHDPIREPLEGDQQLGKRAEMLPGR
jgi:hypothetical protein